MVQSPNESLLILDHGRQPKYDLKFPIILLRDEAKTASLKEAEEVVPSLPTEKPRTISRGIHDLCRSTSRFIRQNSHKRNRTHAKTGNSGNTITHTHKRTSRI